MTMAASEQVLMLGKEQNLVAIWTPPQASAIGLTVVLVNAGVIHRVGPHRLHVKLARQLAAQGMGCVRFDLSGMGDSRAPEDGTDFRSQAVLDLRTVMDELARRSDSQSFALVGICSGAAHAQAAALIDERVKGVFLIDGYMYPSWRGSAYFLLQMVKAYGVLQTCERVMRVLYTRMHSRVRPQLALSEAPPEPRRSALEFSRDMQDLTQRQVQVCLMFTGSVLEVIAHPNHLRQRFARAAWLDQVLCLIEPDLDHTFTLKSSQRRLADCLLPWLLTLRSTLQHRGRP
jgi:pimeloyl-ACP methyl ester carboxylesterase